MSIELLLLQWIEISSGCTKKLVFPAPETCDSTVQFFNWMAAHHFLTWLAIGFFFIMLIIASTFMIRK